MRILIVLAALFAMAMPVAAQAAPVTAKVDISEQKMRVYQGGRLKYTWKVSTGAGKKWTPRGTFRPQRFHKEYYSKKYNNAPMPYSIFFHKGYAVHGTNQISKLGRPASKGCVRLHPKNAAKLFSMVRRNGGRIVIVN